MSLDRKSIAIMGSGAVGKSSITCQWIRGEFRDEYDPTIMVPASQRKLTSFLGLV